MLAVRSIDRRAVTIRGMRWRPAEMSENIIGHGGGTYQSRQRRGIAVINERVAAHRHRAIL